MAPSPRWFAITLGRDARPEEEPVSQSIASGCATPSLVPRDCAVRHEGRVRDRKNKNFSASAAARFAQELRRLGSGEFRVCRGRSLSGTHAGSVFQDRFSTSRDLHPEINWQQGREPVARILDQASLTLALAWSFAQSIMIAVPACLLATPVRAGFAARTRHLMPVFTI